MVQEIIVAIIGFIVLGIVAYKIYSFFFVKNKPEGACGCSSCHCNVPRGVK